LPEKPWMFNPSIPIWYFEWVMCLWYFMSPQGHYFCNDWGTRPTSTLWCNQWIFWILVFSKISLKLDIWCCKLILHPTQYSQMKTLGLTQEHFSRFWLLSQLNNLRNGHKILLRRHEPIESISWTILIVTL
jgi:hypothetical protein